MIDSHCHLDHEPLIDNLEAVIQRSKDVGITKLLTISTSLKSFQNVKALIQKDEMIYGSFGIHPHETNNDQLTKELIIQNSKPFKKIIGIGETGLDFFYKNSNEKNQENSFINHVEAAIELDLPIIIHSRDAETKTYEILKDYKNQNPKLSIFSPKSHFLIFSQKTHIFTSNSKNRKFKLKTTQESQN